MSLANVHMMRDHESLFDDDDRPTVDDNVDTHFKSMGAAMLLGCVGAFAGAYVAFTTAPQIGGELWPYIRVAVAVIASAIGFPVGAITGYISTAIVSTIWNRAF